MTNKYDALFSMKQAAERQQEAMDATPPPFTDQEKSVILTKLAGYQVLNTITGERGRVFCNPEGYAFGRFLRWETAQHLSEDEQYRVLCPDIYNPAQMATAWRVLNWAMDSNGPWSMAVLAGDFELEGWLYDSGLWNLSAGVAQRGWLDKIFELVLDAGLHEVEIS